MYRSVGRREARTYDVAAIAPPNREAFLDLARISDEALHGIGLSTPSLVRGARALGLIAGRTFLVDVEATQTVVVVVAEGGSRRYLVAAGLEHCDASMDAAETLAADIARVLAYHAEVACREPVHDATPPRADVVLVGPHAVRARALLDRALGDRLAPAAQRTGDGERITGKDGAPLAADVARVHAAAIGAALESFVPTPERLVVRHPPQEVPAYVAGPRTPGRASRRIAPLALAGVAVVGLALATFWALAPDASVVTRESATAENAGPERGTAQDDETAPTAAPADGPEIDAAGAERQAAAAHTALGALALHIAHARGIAAACAVLASATPPHRARSYDVREVRGTLRITLLSDVEGGITPNVRRAARAAAESVPGIRQVSVDVVDGALRLRYRSAVAARPAPGDGPRRLSPGGLSAQAAAATQRARQVPHDEDGRPRLSVEQARSLAMGGGPDDVPLPLTQPESEFLMALRAAAEGICAGLPAPRTAAPALAATTAGSDGTVTLVVAPPPDAALTLERRRLPDGAWIPAGSFPAGATTLTDHVAGASGRYRWRAGAAPNVFAAEADVHIAVDVELVGWDAATRRPRLRLTRGWKGERIATEIVPPADEAPLRSTADGVLFDPGLVLTSVTKRTATETITERVPEFLPDGTVRRDDGAARCSSCGPLNGRSRSSRCGLRTRRVTTAVGFEK